VRLPLRRAIGRSSSRTISPSLKVSLEGHVNVFSPVCVSEIRITEDVDICAVKVRLVNTLVSSLNQLGSTGSPCTCGNISIFIPTYDGVYTTGGS